MDKHFVHRLKQAVLSKEILSRLNSHVLCLALLFLANCFQVQSLYSQLFKATLQFFGVDFARLLFICQRFPSAWFASEPAIRLVSSRHNFKVRVPRVLKPKIIAPSPDLLTSPTTFLYISRNHSIGNADAR